MKHPHAPLNLLGSPFHWSDARVVLIFLHGPIAPSGPINSYSYLSCAHDPDDNGSTNSGCVF